MTIELDIAPELRARIEAIAARSSLTAREVILDALENGHSLEWQERYLDKLEAATGAADRGEFATDADMERLLTRYRPA